MLGGDDGKSLFMLTAASSDHEEAAKTQTGKILVAEVDSARAGRPDDEIRDLLVRLVPDFKLPDRTAAEVLDLAQS
jgi:hypothetical protein